MAKQLSIEFEKLLQSLSIEIVKDAPPPPQPTRMFKTADVIRQVRQQQRTVRVRPGMTVEEMIENARSPVE